MNEQRQVNAGEHPTAKPEQANSETGKKVFTEPEISEPEDILEVTSFFGAPPISGALN